MLASCNTYQDPYGPEPYPYPAPAPYPQEAFGVPIEETDCIVDTEALTL